MRQQAFPGLLTPEAPPDSSGALRPDSGSHVLEDRLWGHPSPALGPGRCPGASTQRAVTRVGLPLSRPQHQPGPPGAPARPAPAWSPGGAAPGIRQRRAGGERLLHARSCSRRRGGGAGMRTGKEPEWARARSKCAATTNCASCLPSLLLELKESCGSLSQGCWRQKGDVTLPAHTRLCQDRGT